jgi:hypothetical protein
LGGGSWYKPITFPQLAPGPLLYIMVDSVEATIEAVTAAGPRNRAVISGAFAPRG